MPVHRIRQLEAVGFEWRVRPPSLKWEDRYSELLEYKATYGDCNVPQNYPPNKVLGKWVMKQRGFYYDKIRGKKSPLTADRQDKLDAIGFAWVAPHVCKTKAKLPLREGIVERQASRTTTAASVVAMAVNGTSASVAEGRQDHPQPQEQEHPVEHHQMPGLPQPPLDERQYHIPEYNTMPHLPTPVVAVGPSETHPHEDYHNSQTLNQNQHHHHHQHPIDVHPQQQQYTPVGGQVVDASTYPYVTTGQPDGHHHLHLSPQQLQQHHHLLNPHDDQQHHPHHQQQQQQQQQAPQEHHQQHQQHNHQHHDEDQPQYYQL
jgi:hypothetical protein